jgi:8-oxo-dGTP diphosphatase
VLVCTFRIKTKKEPIMKRGCGILFYEEFDEVDRQRKLDEPLVLVYRRDDKPKIPFPDHLDILGGHVEDGETPERAIVREMAEELDDKRTGKPFELRDFQLFSRYIDETDTEQSIYWAPASFQFRDVRLKEGQRLVWINEWSVDRNTLAFGFNKVVKEFFQARRQK